MIFPTESVLALRGSLEDRVNSGEISELEAYREALAADPEDPRALRLLALMAEDEKDFATAEALAWRWLPADPLSHEAFRLIGRLLARDPERLARAGAYQSLGFEKLHFDPEEEADPEPVATEGDTEEPAEVAAEMEPHRVLHAMWTSSTGELDRELVDRALALGPRIAPLLHGMLNLFGEDLLDDVDDALVVRSLALLGEFGDPASLPAICKFLPLQDDTLSQAAGWAVERIAFRNPSEALREIGGVIADAEAVELGVLAEQLCRIPDTPGRTELLKEIGDRVLDFSGDDRAAVALSVIVSAWVMEGLDAPLGAEFLKDYQQDLTPDAKRELKKARKSLEGVGPYVPEPEALTLHDICCPAFEAADEDEPYVRDQPKLGRNDPCWCGSGQKYKKCHLAADESR